MKRPRQCGGVLIALKCRRGGLSHRRCGFYFCRRLRLSASRPPLPRPTIHFSQKNGAGSNPVMPNRPNNSLGVSRVAGCDAGGIHALRFVSAWYPMRNTAAPITATITLYTFNPLTPGMPNAWNSQPPTTAPTMPNRISNNIPSPVLLTSLLAMNPAMRPSTIQMISDISYSNSC
jgi:hypothetical protein